MYLECTWRFVVGPGAALGWRRDRVQEATVLHNYLIYLSLSPVCTFLGVYDNYCSYSAQIKSVQDASERIVIQREVIRKLFLHSKNKNSVSLTFGTGCLICAKPGMCVLERMRA